MLCVTAASRGEVDLVLSPASRTIPLEDAGAQMIEVRLVVETDSAVAECFSSIETIIHYDPSVLQLVGRDQAGKQFDFIIGDGFFVGDPDGLNDDLADGEALYSAFTLGGEAAPLAPGSLATTFQFIALQPTGGTVVKFIGSVGNFAATRVLDCNFGENTGDIFGDAVVRLVDCPSVGTDADADGFRDACDNCPNELNAEQTDADLDGVGDACDPCPTRQPGDVDGNAAHDVDDIPAFVIALLSGDLLLGTAEHCAADLNVDAAVNGLDIQPFVEGLLGP